VRSVNALSILAIPFLLSFFPVYAATSAGPFSRVTPLILLLIMILLLIPPIRLGS
jgi:hypothetical protein